MKVGGFERQCSLTIKLTLILSPLFPVESRTGAVNRERRFQSPLIAPDMRISRIRRSDEAIMRSPTASRAYAQAGG